MSDLKGNITARESILRSIREHLAASAPHDAVYEEKVGRSAPELTLNVVQENDYRRSEFAEQQRQPNQRDRLIRLFKKNLEAVGAHCSVVRSEAEATQALSGIIVDLQKTSQRACRIALSDSPVVKSLFSNLRLEAVEVKADPDVVELFSYDVGVSAAQFAIAETGTLVLESEVEKHRLVSLVPPVHIAMVEAGKICLTIGEALVKVRGGSKLSPTITMITGPSRTADIELTLAIGVHGPRELYVVVMI